METTLWERLDGLEALTRPRPGAESDEAAWIRWPFDNPRPGRFSTSLRGAFNAARELGGALAEAVHHAAIRCREDRLDPHAFDMRVLAVDIEGRFHDLTGRGAPAHSGVLDPGSYEASQALAEALVRQGSRGILYPSVRDASHSSCVAVFDPKAVRRCSHLRFLTFGWDGSQVAPLYEKKPLP
ncbi:MAG TPA: RES family NAD+ phosphorylase [Holophaga sp.]|nr:RES family NAD+ phosphorylase [Holophaga sp.]